MRLIESKKLHLTHVISNTFEAGVDLFGFEVKSLRKKQGSLDGAKVLIRGGEAFLVGVYIPPYQAANTPKSYDPYRTRKLLLKKSEILELYSHEQSKTLTLHPNSLYSTHNLIKCEVAVCKKKDSKDKREDIKKSIARRELRES
ncbi:SsrA-binding protein [Candidatus Gracilibacteria bacterium]|nr:SsrA-binding protein [Candidatus Gracilibacteria bacterium]MCF7898655.1 SsrA-binding protein [Candidatus Paceibacterota bacterium]